MRRQKHNSRRTFETLESRNLMAVDVSFNGGVLTFTGSGNDDIAEIRFDEDEVRAEIEGGNDDDDLTRSIASVNRIVFNGFAGDDQLDVVVEQLDSGITLDHITLEFHGGDNDDTLNGSMHNGVKTIAWGDAGNDNLKGSRYSDVFEGGAGDDELSGGGGDDRYVFSGATNLGIDTIKNEASNVNTDTIDLANYGGDVNVHLESVYSATSPRYGVFGMDGNLRVKLDNSTALENVVGSTSHTNLLQGNSRPNHLKGGNLSDEFEGLGGNDRLEGGAGSDTYSFVGGNLGTDTIVEASSADADLLNFRLFARGVNIDLSKSFGMYGGVYAMDSPDLKLILSSSTAIEEVFGSTFDDVITGNSRDNVLHGFNGNDTITGGGGADELWGDVGDDKLYTDAYDVAYGGAGIDWFDRYRESATATNPKPARYLDWGWVEAGLDQM